jgi:hypothetical protein
LNPHTGTIKELFVDADNNQLIVGIYNPTNGEQRRLSRNDLNDGKTKALLSLFLYAQQNQLQVKVNWDELNGWYAIIGQASLVGL